MVRDVIQTKNYKTASGKEPYELWFDKLDSSVQVIIDARITKLRGGNFGKFKPLRNGVSELIIDYSPGYRIYYGKITDSFILILLGGIKRTQDKDIEKAVEYWKDFEG